MVMVQKDRVQVYKDCALNLAAYPLWSLPSHTVPSINL